MCQHGPLAPRPKPWIVPAGKTIMREGDPGAMMYVVVDGAVDVLVGARRVATIGPGGIVGELAYLTGCRSATVVARQTCWLMPIDRERFEEMLRQTPLMARQVMEQLGERLHAMNRRLASLDEHERGAVSRGRSLVALPVA